MRKLPCLKMIVFMSSYLICHHVLAETISLVEEHIKVIGVTPSGGVDLSRDKLPFAVQSAATEEIERSKSLSIGDFLNRDFAGVSINEVQNNPLQPDIQYRGFTSSPLLGLPQGLAVYQNGVRVNEAFGDTVNWDLIPESSIATLDLIGGANPIFGLNTLGGAISITTKNGFTHPGHSLETYGGAYERVVSTVESGGNNGVWGYFFTGNYFAEDGWRDDSESDALNMFLSVGYEDNENTFDVSVNHADTELIGNGPLPVELAAVDRSAIFTSPDITENNLSMINFAGSHQLSATWELSGNAYFRSNKTDSFNGDGTEFEGCEEVIDDINDERMGSSLPLLPLPMRLQENLCEEFEGDADTVTIDEIEAITDQNGLPIEEENANGEERNAINNISVRDQESFGANLQTAFLNDLFNRENSLIVGASYHQALTEFQSLVEISSLQDDRSTERDTGILVMEEGTYIKTHTRTWSVYLTDTLALTDTVNLTLSGRYNNTHVNTGDRSDGDSRFEEFDGDGDTYDRFNPAIGVTWAMRPNMTIYGSYSESSRAPTPVELSCSHADDPCKLPNAFLADPALDQVVTKSLESGLRGYFGESFDWHIGAYYSTNKDDIIFGSTGGISSNEGFFSNVGDTKRVGIELGLSGLWRQVDWFINYGFLEATFEDQFTILSANHPENAPGGEFQVKKGNRIPGLPEHTLKIGGYYNITPRLTIGADLRYYSEQYYRGDEANLLGQIDGYTIINMNASYQLHDKVTVFAKINNLLDTDYETFGLFGEADEVEISEVGRPLEDGRFVGVGAPLAAYIGLNITF